ncbi:hypothetical protein [Nocardia sp. NPDC003345]
MRKQHSNTYPIRNDQPRFVTRPVPPRTHGSTKGGWPRHMRRGAR